MPWRSRGAQRRKFCRFHSQPTATSIKDVSDSLRALSCDFSRPLSLTSNPSLQHSRKPVSIATLLHTIHCFYSNVLPICQPGISDIAQLTPSVYLNAWASARSFYNAYNKYSAPNSTPSSSAASRTIQNKVRSCATVRATTASRNRTASSIRLKPFACWTILASWLTSRTRSLILPKRRPESPCRHMKQIPSWTHSQRHVLLMLPSTTDQP
jgi:hypothetical protein